MELRAGPLSYEWNSQWAKLPPQRGWAHHGLAVSRNGTIVSGGATDPEILVFDPDGTLRDRFPVPVTETHGITITLEEDQEVLWIVDTGGQVLKCKMDGTALAKLTRDNFDYADDDPFVPTALDVDPSTGRVWITDGYGSSRVHRFSPELKRELTLDGTEGAGRFDCPHWIFCDTRRGNTEIYVADRGNDRIQIFAPNGSFIKCLDEGFITPSAFATFDKYLVVAELNARLVILDADDQIIGEIGNGRDYVERTGWPNRLDANGEPVCPLWDIAEGKFNSPHGIAADPSGNIYVSEWLIGDRYTKLKRTA